MWTSEKQWLSDNVLGVRVRDDQLALGCAGAIDLWRGRDDGFRLFFIDLLKSCPYRCFRLETPPASRRSVDQPFEFVLIDSPEIDLPPDPRDFQAHFDADPADVLVFDNLGGDATMVVPRPREDVPGYAHVAAFTRHAPLAQQQLLWKTVGETVYRSLGDAPLWLNTAGGGVPWLHVRLDSRPKYYVFDPYRSRVG